MSSVTCVSSVIDRVFDVMFRTPHHTIQVLTKRAELALGYMLALLARCIDLKRDHPYIWIGATVESQAYVDRARKVAQFPTAVRFLSCEPLLGPLDVTGLLGPDLVNWAIVGGERGPRPMHPAWARSLRDQCIAAGVPYCHKRNGDSIPEDQPPPGLALPKSKASHRIVSIDGRVTANIIGPLPEGYARVHRVGKGGAGRLLDGREWSEMPALAAAKTCGPIEEVA